MSREPLFTAEDIAKSLVPTKMSYQLFESEAWTLVEGHGGSGIEIDFSRLEEAFKAGCTTFEAAAVELNAQGVTL